MKNIILTGASQGIGFDTVVALSRDKQHRILAIARNQQALQNLKKICFEKYQNEIDIFAHDLTQPFPKPFETLLQSFGHIDVLINNAGILIKCPFTELSLEQWQIAFENNFFSAVRLIQILLPYLRRSDKAHIVNIGSMGGFQGSSKFAGLSAYSASKAALANLTECLAEEFQSFGIKSNCLCLGAVNTQMLQASFPNYVAQVNSPEMAELIAHFALTGHQYWNGKVLPVSLSTP